MQWEWEHGYGIRIDTLENPGWRLHLGLHGTKRQDAASPKAALTRSQDDWISYWVEKEEFQVACGPKNLSEAIDIFVGWFESDFQSASSVAPW
jgi:hypothetical protein